MLNRFGGQFLVYNGTTLPGYLLPSPSILISPSLATATAGRISRSDRAMASGSMISGTGPSWAIFTGVIFQSTEKTPVGFSALTGSQSSVYYTMDLPAYPVGGTMNTQIWEGVLATISRELPEHIPWERMVTRSRYRIHDEDYLTHFSPSGPAELL